MKPMQVPNIFDKGEGVFYLNRLSDSLVLQLVDASNQVSSVLPPQPDLLDPFDEEVLKDLVRSGADPDGLRILLEPEAGR